uniref:YceI family protein n=1 Tax=Flavobacterium sp. TaxID=239 RepID=UPI00404B7E6B
MKNLKTLTIAIIALISFTTNAQTKRVNSEKSTITWLAKKVTGQHEGTVSLKEGALVIKDGKLAGGKFTMDMTSINTTDLDGDMKQKLDGHLKSDDFFSTTKNPTASLGFKTIADKGNGLYTVTADLMIKNISNPITFDILLSDTGATTKLTVDRTKYDIKYKSGSFFENLGDKVIYDDFELTVNLKF